LNLDEFRKALDVELKRLFGAARQRDELSFLFAVLGINSGIEDAGWQPIAETHALVQDLVGLINAPLSDDTKARMALLLYCHVVEANFLYHCLYNLLLTVDGQLPKIFNFLDKYKQGVPPSVSAKLSEIRSKAAEHGFHGINEIFDEIMRPDIRNAFFHSDYILYGGELRLKHRGSQYANIPLKELYALVEKTLAFFGVFMHLLTEARRSFPNGYLITGRKAPDGRNLCSVQVLVDEDGLANGFTASGPLPIW
jgi:hypothetical protein